MDKRLEQQLRSHEHTVGANVRHRVSHGSFVVELTDEASCRVPRGYDLHETTLRVYGFCQTPSGDDRRILVTERGKELCFDEHQVKWVRTGPSDEDYTVLWLNEEYRPKPLPH